MLNNFFRLKNIILTKSKEGVSLLLIMIIINDRGINECAKDQF